MGERIALAAFAQQQGNAGVLLEIGPVGSQPGEQQQRSPIEICGCIDEAGKGEPSLESSVASAPARMRRSSALPSATGSKSAGWLAGTGWPGKRVVSLEDIALEDSFGWKQFENAVLPPIGNKKYRFEPIIVTLPPV